MIGTLYSNKYSDTIYDIIPISFDNIEIKSKNKRQFQTNNDNYNSLDNSHIINVRETSTFCGLDDTLFKNQSINWYI